MKTISQVDNGHVIFGLPRVDGSKPVYILPEDSCELECIGQLMPTFKDSRQQPKSLAQRMLENTIAKRREE